MKIRLGYVAMAIDLKKASPSQTVTFKTYNKIEDDEVKLYKLKKISKNNLLNTKRILLYNATHHIQVYRMTSKLIPLVTHPEVIKWDYTNAFPDIYSQLKNIINKNQFRISAHPDHFTNLGSPRSKVIESSIRALEYHKNIMEILGIDAGHGKLVLHVGGKYGQKSETLDRFKLNFNRLEKNIRNRIILENDDKIYTALEVLELCEELKTPMVLDIHHHWCNNNDEKIDTILPRIFNTWNNESDPPKIHLSSPKSEKNIRAHADDIDFDFFYDFIQKAKILDRDFDIMIEAKNKNIALFNLMKEIKEKTSFQIIDDASFFV